MVNNQVRADIELRLKKVNVDKTKGDIMGDVRAQISQEAAKILERGQVGTKGDAGRLYQNYKQYSESALKALEQIEHTPTYKRAQSILRNLQTGGLTSAQLKDEARKLNSVLGQLGKEGWKVFGTVMRPWDETKMAENLRAGFTGIGGVRGRTGLELVGLIEDLPGVFEKTTERFKVNIDNFNKKIKDSLDKTDNTLRRHGVHISYIASVVNLGMGLARSAGQYYRAEETMFDLNSPQGMASALMQREMTQRSLLYGGGGRTAGAVLGFGAAALLGHPELGFFGSYLGGELLGQAGDIFANVKNVPVQQRMQTFNSMWGWAGRNEKVLEQFQNVTYHAAGRMGWRISPEDIAGRYGYTKQIGKITGLNEAEYAGMALTLQQAHGAFRPGEIGNAILLQSKYKLNPQESVMLETMSRVTGATSGQEFRRVQELGKRIGLAISAELIPSLARLVEQSAARFGPGRAAQIAESLALIPAIMFPKGTPGATEYGNIGTSGGQAVANAIASLTTTNDQATTAFMFAALKRKHPGMNAVELTWMMRQGYTPENLAAQLEMIGRKGPRSRMMMETWMMGAGQPYDIGMRAINWLQAMPEKKYREWLGRLENPATAASAIQEPFQKTISERNLVPGETTFAAPGQRKAAELFQSSADAAERIQKSFLNMEVSWQKAQNTMVADGALLSHLFKGTLEEAWRIYYAVMNGTGFSTSLPGKGATDAQKIAYIKQNGAYILHDDNVPAIPTDASWLKQKLSSGARHSDQDIQLGSDEEYSITYHITRKPGFIDATGKKGK